MHSPQVDFALRYIRAKLMAGEFSAGQSLSALNLSKQMGISRTPVLFALRALEKEGLVTITPHLGASVTSISDQDYQEILSLRELLETHAVGLAALHRTESDLADLKTQLDKMNALQNREEDPEYSAGRLLEEAEPDLVFHLLIARASGHKLILQELKRLHLQQQVFTHNAPCTPYSLAAYQRTCAEHLAIYNAIRERSPEKARAAMKEHLQWNEKNTPPASTETKPPVSLTMDDIVIA